MTDEHVIDEPTGRITLPASALAQVVVRSAEDVEGARVRRPRRGLEVDVEGGRATVSLELGARYGVVLPALARDVQAAVAESLRSMCGLEVDRVDVSVEELDGG